MFRPFAGTIIRRHYIDRPSRRAPLREKALAIRANTCGPAVTFRERKDVPTPWAGAGHYAIYMKQAIQPMYECRDDRAIFADLAQRLGINDDDDKTEEQWLSDLTKDAVDDFEAFKEAGVARFAPPKDAVAFADQIRAPPTPRFTTPPPRRGIADGQKVRILNDRVSTSLPVKVARRIAQDVVSMNEGAWLVPDDDGTDTKGCANVLADDRSAPCGATQYESRRS